MGLVALITIFVLAIFVGFEIITKLPPTLHTPLMSGSNAISGITLVGALIAAGQEQTTLVAVLGLFLAVAALASFVPAARASRTSPITVLRAEERPRASA